MSLFIELFHLFEAVETIEGKKRLQKMIHLLQECGGARFGMTFKLARFGAFSGALAVEIDDFAEHGLLEKEPIRVGSNPSIRYSKSEEFDDVIEKLEIGEIPAWTSLAKDLNQRDTPDLEAISTVVFLLRSGTLKEDLQDDFKKLKPHLEGRYDSAESDAFAMLAKKLIC